MLGVCPSKWEVGVLQASLYTKPTASWASLAHAKGGLSVELQRQRRKPLDGCGSGGTSNGRMLLGHRPGTDHSRSGCLGEGV